MIKLYTPEAWLSLFGGSPSLVIDDHGYIYTADGYYKIISDSPVGKIDYEKGYIYDKHYTDVIPTPIAYMTRDGDVTKVRKYGESRFSDPILYIQGDEIYTPEEYLRLFGGNASGYIKDTKVGSGGSTSDGGTSGGKVSGQGGGLPGGRIAAGLGVAIIAGIIYLLSDEGRVASTTMVLAIMANLGAAIYFLVQTTRGKLHFQWDGKRFAKALLTGIGVYIAATAVFCVLGLISNLGTGNHISDAGGDKMELAALFIGVPFVIKGLFAEGAKQPGTAKTKTSARKTSSGFSIFDQPTTSKRVPQSTYQAAQTKIVPCPHCGVKTRVPVGKGRIKVTCPISSCGKVYEIDT